MAFHHCVHGKSWLWLFLLGPAPFAFCFVSLLDGEAHIWLGDLRFALCGLCLCFVCAFDLPSYMTTGVYVDVILNCFFSCKDRASERDRPYRRKKIFVWLSLCPPLFVSLFFSPPFGFALSFPSLPSCRLLSWTAGVLIRGSAGLPRCVSPWVSGCALQPLSVLLAGTAFGCLLLKVVSLIACLPV